VASHLRLIISLLWRNYESPALTAELRALKNFRRLISREASSDAFPRFRDSTIWTDQRSGVEDGVARVK